MKECADDNFKFDENGKKFSRRVENTKSNFSFSHIVFKRLVQLTRKNQGLFGKVLKFIKSYRENAKNVLDKR